MQPPISCRGRCSNPTYCMHVDLMRLFEYAPTTALIKYGRPFSEAVFVHWIEVHLAQGYKYLAFDGDHFIFSPAPILPKDRQNGPVSLVHSLDKAKRLFIDLPRHRVQQYGPMGATMEAA